MNSTIATRQRTDETASPITSSLHRWSRMVRSMLERRQAWPHLGCLHHKYFGNLNITLALLLGITAVTGAQIQPAAHALYYRTGAAADVVRHPRTGYALMGG